MADEAEVESYKVKMRCGKKYTGGKREYKTNLFAFKNNRMKFAFIVTSRSSFCVRFSRSRINSVPLVNPASSMILSNLQTNWISLCNFT